MVSNLGNQMCWWCQSVWLSQGCELLRCVFVLSGWQQEFVCLHGMVAPALCFASADCAPSDSVWCAWLLMVARGQAAGVAAAMRGVGLVAWHCCRSSCSPDKLSVQDKSSDTPRCEVPHCCGRLCCHGVCGVLCVCERVLFSYCAGWGCHKLGCRATHQPAVLCCLKGYPVAAGSARVYEGCPVCPVLFASSACAL